MGLASTFAAPYFRGKNTYAEAGGDPVGGGVWLLGKRWMIDTADSGFRRQTVPMSRPQLDTTSGGGAVSLNSTTLWHRAPTDWSLGAGQSSWDRDERSNRRRFSSSRRVDVWEEDYLSLLPATELARANASALQWTWVADGLIWHVGGNGDLAWSTDGESWNTVVTGLASVVGSASDGQGLYLAADGGLYFVDGTTKAVSQVPGVVNPDDVWFVMERLFVSVGAKVDEVLWDGAATVLDTVFDPPRLPCVWVDVVAAYGGLFLMGNLGSKAMVYRVSLNPDGTAWEAPVAVAWLPDGESMQAGSAYLGFVLLSTSAGVRLAQVSPDGSLLLGGLTDTPGEAWCFEGEREYVWMGAEQENGQGSLVRMNLAEFASQLAPAWASDLEATDVPNGVPLPGRVTSVATLLGKRVFTVAGQGLVREAGVPCIQGELHQGHILFGIADRKTPTDYRVWTDPLALGASVGLQVDFAGTDPEPILNHVAQGSIQTAAKGTGEAGPTVYPVLILRALNGVSPRVWRLEVRAIPLTQRSTMWSLPLLIADVLDFKGVTERRDSNDDYHYLTSAVLRGDLATLRVDRKVHQVQLMDFEWKPMHLSVDGQAWQGTLTVVCQTVEEAI
jgi:hypothetical protein